ncbi:BZ3500_MvSof-1268-A1-R1_Chr9g10348 [Microbotryum saponariae]|uniref:BZ3500_MvSof-1268-A1-R1_Chr9g10348 protein n=1 Tax=Microbotryum saponariae TaxID=289078 RepID=A0A2X0N402_9BASI|nr:BZ3501_MvSof-1269-A2-R1_Chr9g10098 [Microbotryum saponariae]SCZ99946.1 BZ3500_MvSof-1268-A1-R1_Chr9g10348 [Microbotryum saponariae]
MSRSLFRLTTLRTVLVARPTSVSALGARRFASTHHDGHHVDHNAGDVFPEEGKDAVFSPCFNAPFYSKIAFAAVAAFVLIRMSPATNPTTSESQDEKPYITRYIEHNLTPRAGVFKEHNQRHLEMAIAAAEDKLLFQEAERPRVRRMRNPGMFDQASPHAIPVGSQADLSNLVIKSEQDDFAEGL